MTDFRSRLKALVLALVAALPAANARAQVARLSTEIGATVASISRGPSAVIASRLMALPAADRTLALRPIQDRLLSQNVTAMTAWAPEERDMAVRRELRAEARASDRRAKGILLDDAEDPETIPGERAIENAAKTRRLLREGRPYLSPETADRLAAIYPKLKRQARVHESRVRRHALAIVLRSREEPPPPSGQDPFGPGDMPWRNWGP